MILIVLFLVLVFILCSLKKSNENFKVLGSMGNLKSLYYRCINECEKTDPTKQMTPTKGSMACLAYCDSIITDLARRGGASYTDDLKIGNVNVNTNIDDAYNMCGPGTRGSKCRSVLTTNYQIDDKCRQDCEYSTLPQEICMDNCSQSRSSANSIGWSWK